MKRYEVNTTLHFKRSDSESVFHERFLLPKGVDLEEAIKKYHLQRANHDVSKIEVLSVKNTNYAKHNTIIVKKKDDGLEFIEHY